MNKTLKPTLLINHLRLLLLLKIISLLSKENIVILCGLLLILSQSLLRIPLLNLLNQSVYFEPLNLLYGLKFGIFLHLLLLLLNLGEYFGLLIG